MTDYSSTDPRLQPGANVPDFAKEEAARLANEYLGFQNTLEDLAEQVKKAPDKIEDDETALSIGGIIKRLRDLRERLENTRAVEKEPHLRRGNAVDAFFNGLKKIIQPEDKRERRTMPGHIDVLQGKIDVYQDEKERKERARLESIRIEAERQAKIAADKLEAERKEAQRLIDEAARRQEEAERARAPTQIERKTEIAEEASKDAGEQQGQVAGAEIAAEHAQGNAEKAYIDTLAKPADLVRTRGVTEQGGGVTLTKAKENYAEVSDRTKLDPVKLFPYFSDAEVEKALRGFAKATQYREKMDGAVIGSRTKGVTR